MREDHTLEAGACAEEILKFALARLTTEREEQAGWVLDLTDQLQTARLLLAEAEVAEEAIKKLLAGDLYAKNDAILGAAEGAEEVAAPAPVAEPVDVIEWADVRWPWTDAHWRFVYEMRWPVVVEAKPTVAVTPEPAAPAAPTSRVASPAPADRPIAHSQDDAVLATLRRLIGDKGEVTISLSALAAEADVPKGSVTFIAGRLRDAGLVEIIVAERIFGRKPPNTYRLSGPAQPHPPEPAPRKAAETWVANVPAAVVERVRPPEPEAPVAAPEPREIDLSALAIASDSPPGFGPCTLMNLRRDQCHWPTGDARPQLYCGAVANPGEEYCRAHRDSMFARTARRAPQPTDPRAVDARLEASRQRRSI